MRDLIKSLPTPEENAKTVMVAFSSFDREGSGTVRVHEIRNIMMTLGEKLPGEIIDEMLVFADPFINHEKGELNYEDFVNATFAK